MQEEKKVSTAWSTQDEINHIKHMLSETGSEALKLITGYITGIAQRTEWGSLDKEKIQAYANAALDQLKEA